MRGWMRVLLPGLMSIAIAVSLTFVQGMGRDSNGDGVPVFGQKSKRLQDSELVDRIAPLPLQLKIAKVDWNDPTLAVDLLVEGNNSTQHAVYEDLYELVQFGFFQTSNVKQVLVRVLEKPESGNDNTGARLVLTMDARSDQFGKKERNAGDPGTTNLEPFLKSHARITYTGLWSSRFGG